jgi:methylthioribulose-1-phosphate dehydratase
MSTQQLSALKEEIAGVIRAYHVKGWSPATSTNYSFKDDSGTIWVSKSGVDKAYFSANDFMNVTTDGEGCGEYVDIRPSAETLIHCTLYKLFPEVKVILHSHGAFPVVLSSIVNDEILFDGYEILKGFEGISTHETALSIPVFDNSQDMKTFCNLLEKNKEKLTAHSFVMRKHGTYAWGKDLFSAKRHIETLDYLCQCKWMIRSKP